MNNTKCQQKAVLDSRKDVESWSIFLILLIDLIMRAVLIIARNSVGTTASAIVWLLGTFRD